MPLSALVGRRAELTALVAACRTGGVTLVTGEAGIGKSRLLDEVAGLVTGVLRGHAVPGGGPFRPLEEALVRVAPATPAADPRLVPFRAVLARLLPGWPTPPPAGAHVVDPVVVLGEAVLELLRVLAGAADLFLRGVDGPDHRALLRARLGEDAPDRLVRDAAFFFADEIRAAAVDWDIDAVTAARIRARTLLVAGAESRTPMFAEAVAMLAGWLPDATAVELPGVGHGMTLQDPAAVARLVADFVRG